METMNDLVSVYVFRYVIIIVEEEYGSSGAFPVMGFFLDYDYEINCMYLPDDCSQMRGFGLLFLELVVDTVSFHIKVDPIFGNEMLDLGWVN